MLFSIIAALLTLSACLAILLPVVRGGRNAPADTDFDLEVYQDQLAEIGRDAARGVIGTAEAEQARAEIGRRILKLAAERRADRGGAGTRAGRAAATLAVLALPLASWGIYAATGSPHLPAQPLQARLEANPANSTMAELIGRAEAHLAANPDDGRGWEVLAPIYFRTGRYDDAVAAYRQAIRLVGATASREAGLGEAIAAAADGTIVEEAQAAFRRALAIEPGNAKARFMLAAALAQHGQADEAAAALRALQRDLAPDSPWQGAVAQALARVEAEAARPGPSAQDVEAAGLIPDKDRAEMIDNMVAGLDARLRENPDDPEGWRRLVQSYVVLDRPEAATDALMRGLEALGRDSGAAAELAAFAAERGVRVTE